MKFAFIVDTSPLMQIKKSVISEFPSARKQEDSKIDAKSESAASSSLSKDEVSASTSSTGMSFFEQSIYAIEEFVAIRKKLGMGWKQDKYLLALTASNPESNAAIEIELPSEEPNNEDIPEEDAVFYHNENQGGDPHATRILSNVWHPFRHFMAQLQHLKNPRRHSKIKRTLLDVLQALNSKRFVHGADNRLQGIQLSRIDPCNILLFTASPKMSSACIDQFMKASERQPAHKNARNFNTNTPDFFEEAFRWDQHLHTLCFRESLRNGTKMANPALLELSKLTGGSYSRINSFTQLKTIIEKLAQNSITTVSLKLNQRLIQCYFNVQSKVKRPALPN